MFHLKQSDNSVGKNGYTILKEKLDKQKLTNLKKLLTVKPKICQNYGAPDQGSIEPIILYQENKDKIYIPRYFGNVKYGLPAKSKIQKSISTNLKTNKNIL